jgi:hypothetical protein
MHPKLAALKARLRTIAFFAESATVAGAILAIALPCLAGCMTQPGDSGDAGAPEACSEPVDKADADLTSPQVSFAIDVMPTFQTSCGIAGSICHGMPGVSAQGRPFLGYFDGGTDAAEVEEVLVGVPSAEDPAMNLVTAGNLDQSYLWVKLDNLQCTQAAECAKSKTPYRDCGQSMPYSNPPLEPGTLRTVARWIAQGAKNN